MFSAHRTQLITDIFPENIAKSVAKARFCKWCVQRALRDGSRSSSGSKAPPDAGVPESLSETMFKFTNL